MAKRKKNRFAFPIGVIAMILAVIGAVTVIKFGINSVKNLADNTAKKAEYEAFLTPVVMFDPDPFDDLTQAEIPQLVNSAVWALLKSEKGTEGYAYSDGGIVVPQADIEKYFIQLFGREIDISSMHQSIDMSDYDITYDSALKSYILPITGIDSAYAPKVYDIDKQGSSVILTVGYIGAKAWAQNENGELTAPEPDKIMKITLRESSGEMYISSIQNADSQEVIAVVSERHEEEMTDEAVSAETAVPEEEPLTTAVEVTDENGEAVTDESGNAVTEYAEVEKATDELTETETETEEQI